MIDVKFTDNTDIVLAVLERAKERALTMCSIVGTNRAQEEIQMPPKRVDTGRLMNSIHGRVAGNSAEIATNVEYAIYVHEGTMKMEANRFLRNAIERHQDDYKKIIENEFKNTQI